MTTTTALTLDDLITEAASKEDNMDIVKETAKVFDSISTKRTGAKAEVTIAVEALEIGEVIRIKTHVHSGKHCNMVLKIHGLAQKNGRKFSARHDGDDLLVKRVV